MSVVILLLAKVFLKSAPTINVNHGTALSRQESDTRLKQCYYLIRSEDRVGLLTVKGIGSKQLSSICWNMTMNIQMWICRITIGIKQHGQSRTLDSSHEQPKVLRLLSSVLMKVCHVAYRPI
jgi:hypothetical protein